MDQVPLVNEQIEDARRLLECLAQEGFAVTAACWGIDDDADYWRLYLVSPVVEADGKRKAYLRTHAVIREMMKTGFCIDPYTIQLVRPSTPLAEAVLAAQRRNPGGPPVRYNGVSLTVAIKQATVPRC